VTLMMAIWSIRWWWIYWVTTVAEVFRSSDTKSHDIMAFYCKAWTYLSTLANDLTRKLLSVLNP